jgi:predicted RNA binding protein YcfA (HicA-like mRNA interferase family)
MRQSKAGWRFGDLERVYLGLGFEVVEGGKHRLYIHPKFPELRATVARSRSLPIGYVQHALKLAERLKQMEELGEEQG